jgi:hypothetical protein
MDESKLTRAARPAALGGYLKKTAPAMGHEHAGHGHAEHGSSTRTAEHNGHQIVLTTTYRVEVDGKELQLPLMVDDSGTVHSHSLPNYQFESALDMVKAAIDLFPEEFADAPAERPKAGHAQQRPKSARKGGASRRKKP